MLLIADSGAGLGIGGGELAGLTAALIWAFSLSAWRYFGQGFSSASLNLFKCLITVVCLSATMLFWPAEWPDQVWIWSWLILSGMIGLAISDLLLFVALQRIGASTTSALQLLAPPLTALLAWFTLGEVLTAAALVGMIVTLLGILLVVHSGPASPAVEMNAVAAVLARQHWWTGLVMALAAAATQSVAQVMMRSAMQSTSVLVGTMLRILPAILLLTLFLRVFRPAAAEVGFGGLMRRPRTVVILALTAFAGSYVGLVLYSYTFKHTPSGIAATLTATTPLWIIPVSWYFLGERVTWRKTLGTLLAFGGIMTIFDPMRWFG